jgi:hypothetical protein
MIVRRANGHAHYGYELTAPVTYYERSREAPQRLLSVVERGFSMQLGADPGYAGFLAKTPFHRDWITMRCRDRPFELRELALHIDVDAVIKKTRGAPEMGVGRNCTIFDELRVVAYSEVRRFKSDGAEFSVYHNRLMAIAAGLNANPAFIAPLHHSELAGIVRSVARWTWRKYSPAQFSQIQSIRGKRGNSIRWADHVPLIERRPWETDGMSRATWYRRNGQAQAETIAISDKTRPARQDRTERTALFTVRQARACERSAHPALEASHAVQ